MRHKRVPHPLRPRVLGLAASVGLAALVGFVQLAPAARGDGLTAPEWRMRIFRIPSVPGGV